MPNRILFVDDEPQILEGLRLSFHSMRKVWSMEFALNGEQALQAMNAGAYDLVIADLRMPKMSGAEFLDEVSRRFPQTVRMALSGQCDRETIVRSVGPIHQYLSKPCDHDQLKARIEQALALRDLLGSSDVKAVVSQLRTIPSLPASYQEILAELQSTDANVENVARLISEDMGMTAKCLQLANSAFLGIRTRVSSVGVAVKVLGYDAIQALVLSSHIFSQFRCDYISENETRWLWDHSLAVSGMAKRLADLQGAEKDFVDDSFTAGLLHDVGKLILASSLKAKYREVLEISAAKNIGITAAERTILGCSHAEVGAYLLGIWGLPSSILEAVAWHQRPSDGCISQFSPLTVVHAACVYHSEILPSRLADQSALDAAHFVKLGLEQREPLWHTACQNASIGSGAGK